MHRSSLAISSLLILSGAAGAQSVDRTRLHPITVPIRDAGTLELASGSWLGRARSVQGPQSTVVYDNTCPWTGGSQCCGSEPCEDLYDEGRIPSWSDPMAPPCAEMDNGIESFEIGYCTYHPTGEVDIKISWWDHNGGGCVGGVPQSPIVAPAYNGAAFYADLAGYGLPGDRQGGGNLPCWTVTIDVSNSPFCLLSDGDGSWNSGHDQFNWAFQHEMDSSAYGGQTGPIIAAEPDTADPGACTFDDPCTAGCGTGLDTEDQYWVNTDGGSASASCPNARNTGCYSFGGWSENPFASFHLKLTASGPCGLTTIAPVVYCTFTDPSTKTWCGKMQCPSFLGCTPRISTSNMCDGPHKDHHDYDLIVTGADFLSPATFVGSKAGRSDIPFSSGTLCCRPPIRRTGPQLLLGSPPCGGSMTLRLNDPSVYDPVLNQPPGTVVNYQAWIRDRLSHYGSNLSDAIEVVYR